MIHTNFSIILQLVKTYKIIHDWEVKCLDGQDIFYQVTAVTENFNPSCG